MIERLRNIKIFYKFFAAFFLIGLVTVPTLSFWFYSITKSAIIDRTFAQLQSVNVLKRQQVEHLFENNSPTINEINEIMLETTGMGSTGETYIVDNYYHMVTYSRFYPISKQGNIIVKTKASQEAHKGNSSSEIIYDYRGESTFSVYSPLHIKGHKWVIISEIDYSEAIKPVDELGKKTIIVGILTFLATTLASLVLTRIVVGRIKLLQKPIIQLSNGEIPKEQIIVKDRDEIGHMVESVNKLIHSFEKMTKIADEIGKGNLNYYFKPISKDDILGNSLLKMRQQLYEYSEKEKEQQRIRTHSLLEVEERERRRIARELHDSLGQMLTGLKFKLEAVHDLGVKEELKKLTDETIVELKHIINNLLPTVLADFGLEAGLRLLCERVKNYGNIEIVFVYEKNDESVEIPFKISIFLYRIVQEVLNNALKHAQATKINVSVDKFEDKVFLFIKDNGLGFNIDEEYEGNGLRNIKERVSLLQGILEINSSKEGTTVNIEIPL
jgi:two-component system, NarL family, sensor kinase